MSSRETAMCAARLRGIAVCAAVLASTLILSATGIAGTPEDAFREGLSAYRSSDYERARTIWLELAERGEAKAQSALGFLYLTGLRVEQNDKEAARWFEAAANQGVPEAQYYLGTLYLQGRGVPANPPAAHFWCELAISLGLTEAMQAAY